MKTDTRATYLEAVQAAVETLARGLDEPMVLNQLAYDACLSSFHFHRIFRGMVGETPGEFLRRLRLERAAYTLLHSSCPVGQIALDAGYQAHEAFIRAFRLEYLTSPRGFRQNRPGHYTIAAPCGVHYDPRGFVPTFIPRDTGGKNMNVEIVEQPTLRLATIRHVGPYHQISVAFGRLCGIVGPLGLFGREGVNSIAVYYDDPDQVPADQLTSDAAVSLPDGFPVPDGCTERTIPGGKHAQYVHMGPYSTIGDAWARFMGEWLPSSGYQMGEGIPYEVYRNDPQQVAPEEVRTDLYLPIA